MTESKPTKHRSSFIDLTGKRFGKWTVIAEAVNYPSRNIHWTCICECGTEKTVAGHKLTGDRSHGCKPCSKRQHGMKGTPEYVAWKGIKQRCHNSNSPAFAAYGGSGKVVCDRWLESFEDFYADMGPKPSASHSVDRIDGSKGYSPDNCRWATPGEQARNKRTNRLITFNDKTMCLVDWAAEVGISRDCLQMRLRLGWSIERALTEPVKAKS